MLLLLLLIVALRTYTPVFDYVAFQWYNRNCKNRNYRVFDGFGVKVPEGYMIHGIDVSHYVCAVNWDSVKNMRGKRGEKIDFAFFRSSIGAVGRDYQFQENWNAARQNFIIRGAYHYFKPNDDVKDQVEHYLKLVKLQRGDLPPVLDIEERGNTSNENFIRRIKTWLLMIEKQTGVKPIIYCNLSYYNDFIKDNFKNYPIWIARYNATSAGIAQENWHFWQYSNRGTVTGACEYVDLNVFNGTFDELRSICLSKTPNCY